MPERSADRRPDACYVALAEALDAAFLTSDAKLAAAPGTRCTFRLL